MANPEKTQSVLYRHQGCETPMLRYMGNEPDPLGAPLLRHGDWQLPSGRRMDGPELLVCPDCGEDVLVASSTLEKIPSGA